MLDRTWAYVAQVKNGGVRDIEEFMHDGNDAISQRIAPLRYAQIIEPDFTSFFARTLDTIVNIEGYVHDFAGCLFSLWYSLALLLGHGDARVPNMAYSGELNFVVYHTTEMAIEKEYGGVTGRYLATVPRLFMI